MKHLFVFLLLANCVFFMWEKLIVPGWQAEEHPARATALDRIVLVKELPPVPEVLAKEPLATVDALPPSPPPTSRCVRIGPLAGEADSTALRKHVADFVERMEVEHSAVQIEKGFWVLSPTAPSIEAARATKHKLMEQGAAEALIIADGEYARAVSLGYFKDRIGAEKLLRTAKANGMDVSVKPQLASAKADWLWLRFKPGTGFDAALQSWLVAHPRTAAADVRCP